jgi:hypothetical protein
MSTDEIIYSADEYFTDKMIADEMFFDKKEIGK